MKTNDLDEMQQDQQTDDTVMEFYLSIIALILAFWKAGELAWWIAKHLFFSTTN